MADNSLKQMSVYSTLERKTLIEGMLKDMAEIQHRSVSAAKEETLLSALCSDNRWAQSYLSDLYNGRQTMQEIIGNIFEENGYCLDDGKAEHDNFAPLVRLTLGTMQKSAEKYDGQDERMHELFFQIDQVISILDKKYRADVPTSVIYLKHVRQDMEQIPQYVRKCDTCNALMQNWEDLKQAKWTYLALAELVRMQDSWESTAESRIYFAQIIWKIAEGSE